MIICKKLGKTYLYKLKNMLKNKEKFDETRKKFYNVYARVCGA